MQRRDPDYPQHYSQILRNCDHDPRFGFRWCDHGDFAFITVAGIDTLTKSVDMTKMGNMMVVGISVSVGLMFNGQGKPFLSCRKCCGLFFPEGVIVTFVLAIVLNLLFNFDSVVGKKAKP